MLAHSSAFDFPINFAPILVYIFTLIFGEFAFAVVFFLRTQPEKLALKSVQSSTTQFFSQSSLLIFRR